MWLWKLKMQLCSSRFGSRNWLFIAAGVSVLCIMYYSYTLTSVSEPKEHDEPKEDDDVWHFSANYHQPKKRVGEIPPIKPAGNLSKFHDLYPTYRERREQADSVCRHVKFTKVRRVVQHAKTNSAYCVTAKVGCTFWISVYRWLYGETWGKTYQSPLDLPRFDVHDISTLKVMRYFQFEDGGTPDSIQTQFRFMFVREPYRRLWSAYVDKFLLPDLWHVDGFNIVLNQGGVTNLKKVPQKEKDKICSNSITFQQFLEYITNVDPLTLNEHYKPVYYLCSPCLFRPHLIGKMETFDQDSANVLKLFNMGWVADEAFGSKETYEEREITLLTDFNFLELKKVPMFKKRSCIDRMGLAYRLWRAFQINGYIPNNVSMPLRHGQHDITRDEFLQKALAAYHRNAELTSPKARKAQKTQEFENAYKNIPDSLINKVRKLFDLDFKLFGYDAYPEVLYKSRSQLARGV